MPGVKPGKEEPSWANEHHVLKDRLRTDSGPNSVRLLLTKPPVPRRGLGGLSAKLQIQHAQNDRSARGVQRVKLASQ